MGKDEPDDGGGHGHGAGHEHGHREELEARVDTFLGEFRMVTPGIAALLGFQLMVAFSERFTQAPEAARLLNFVGLAASALAFLFLLVPANYHRFTRQLAEDDAFLRYARTSNAVAFVFIPVAVAASLGVQAMMTFASVPAGAAAMTAFLVLSSFAWWLVPWRRATRLGEHEAVGRQRRERLRDAKARTDDAAGSSSPEPRPATAEPPRARTRSPPPRHR